MKKLITIMAVCGALLGGQNLMAADTLDDLLKQVREQRQRVSAENQEREQRFQRERNNQRALLQQAQAELAQQEQRSNDLTAAFNANEQEITELQDNLEVQVGNFGELFGVVRQVAGDTVGIVNSSLVSAQYPDRGTVATELAGIKGLPSIEDLDKLRILLFEEIAASSRVVKFPTTIRTADGNTADAEVVRLGDFNLLTGDRFLEYEPETGSIKELPRQPAQRFRDMAANLTAAAPGATVATAVDPGRGQLLKLLIQAPDYRERIDQGGFVGYIIIGLGIIGLLIALLRWVTLGAVGAGIRKQLKSDTPSDKNPLGRILAVYHENRDIDTETLELKLDEAILREAPKLEKWQGGIKVLAAVAPLLGLLGTVTGMIATFQAITLFGTGDPKLMAGGISEALVTTWLGLIVAIPLVLLHSVVAGRSRGLIEILEEQTAGIIAKQSEGGA
jgi:biopolymer transport protein ExbB